MLSGFFVTKVWRVLKFRMKIGRGVNDVLNELSNTADKEWSSIVGVGGG
jgi:hypothetical protein